MEREAARPSGSHGQLADINYLRNQTALFDEFRETGMSNKLGYNSVADLRANYPDFFWSKNRHYECL
jgi:hypothetical protein